MDDNWPVGETRFLGMRRGQAIATAAVMAAALVATVAVLILTGLLWVLGLLAVTVFILSFMTWASWGNQFWLAIHLKSLEDRTAERRLRRR